MDEWNTTHHGQSDLTKRVRESTIDESQTSAELLGFFRRAHPEERRRRSQATRFIKTDASSHATFPKSKTGSTIATSMSRRSKSSRSAGTQSSIRCALRRRGAIGRWMA